MRYLEVASAALLSALPLAACDAGAPAPVAVASAPVIIGSENWDYLDRFAASQWAVGSQYGKAIAAAFLVEGKVCTAVAYDDRGVTTANHCGREPFKARFGDFQSGWSIGRGRLQDLGLSEGAAASLAVRSFTDFNCTFTRSYDTAGDGYRDINAFSCALNTLPGLGQVGPGDVWGFIEMSRGPLAEGTGIYALTYGKRSTASAWEVMLSPGAVSDSVTSCTGDYMNCFEHTADTQEGGGGSGGALMRLGGGSSANTQLGVQNGACCVGDYDNSATYHLPFDRYPHVDYWLQLLATSYETSASPHVGGFGGTAASSKCPAGTMVGGVIGTTYPWDAEGDAEGHAGGAYVGNFGVVCVPFVASTHQAHRLIDNWVVQVGGSYDTRMGASSEPFNRYVHTVLDRFADGGGAERFEDLEQPFVMCPPGYYVFGVQVRDDDYVERVESIACRRWDDANLVSRSPRKDIGTLSVTPPRWAMCPPSASGEPTFAYALKIRSGDWTDGFQLSCRTVD